MKNAVMRENDQKKKFCPVGKTGTLEITGLCFVFPPHGGAGEGSLRKSSSEGLGDRVAKAKAFLSSLSLSLVSRMLLEGREGQCVEGDSSKAKEEQAYKENLSHGCGICRGEFGPSLNRTVTRDWKSENQLNSNRT